MRELSWGFSSAGRASALHAEGQEFESPNLHHKKPNDIRYSVFYFVWVGFDEKLPMYKVHFKGVRMFCIRDFEIKYRKFDILVGSCY